MKYEITVEVGSSDKRHLGHEIAKMNNKHLTPPKKKNTNI